MNIKKIITIGVAGVAMGAMALDNVEVTDVKARQRYPWNGKVDIDFTLDSKPTEPYQMQVEVYDNIGKTNLPVKSVCTESVSMESNPCMVRTDTSRIVWDASKDLPNGFKCTNVLVSCRDDRAIAPSNRYMIVDLSGGTTALSFPISYTNCPPTGGWSEEYMTTKMVLRRVEAQTFYMGSPLSDTERQGNEDYHQVRLTKPFYIGVFEVTAKQYSLICGGDGSDTKPVTKTWNEIRGFDTGTADTVNYSADAAKLRITQSQTTTSYCWPNTSSVDANSFMGKLRTKTAESFDLPTEAQWECACRAGALMPLNIGTLNTDEARSLISGPAKPAPGGTHYLYVGNYMPNSIGVYDMSGNVGEWCLDVYGKNLGTAAVTDPAGPSVSYGSCVPLSCTVSNVLRAKIVYRGVTYSGYDAYYNYLLEYTAKGISRVVKGVAARSAVRTSALNINTSGPVFTDGVSVTGKGVYKASYSSPAYGIRVALAAE